MSLFPVHRPRLVVKVGEKTLSVTRIEATGPGWPGASLRRRCDRPTPSGLVRVSAEAPNVTEASALAAELRALRRELPGSGRGAEPVTLSLPDLCARVALLDFETLPAGPAERQALLSRRLRDKCHLPALPLRLVSRSFRRTDAPGGGEGVRVLAVALLESVLAGYEQACRLAGFLPASVGLHSLQLFDRCRPALQRAEGRMGEQLFLVLNEESFGFLAIRRGCPAMVRLAPSRPEEPAGDRPDELMAAMQFYAEIVPELLGAGSRPLFAVEAAAPPGAGGMTAARLISPAAAEALGVRVIPLDRDGRPVLTPPAVVTAMTPCLAMEG